MGQFTKSAAAVVLVAIITPITSAGVMLAAYLYLPLPATLPERTPPAPSQISRVFDATGNEIGTFKQFETSIPVAKGDIPTVLKQAVIAAEDRGFYSHGGVDLRGTLRALVADLRNRGASQGGSTITQQLVKNTLTGNQRSIQRKIREAVLASQLDRATAKDDILFEYLSIIYLGEGAYGVGAAAETYFRKPVSQLTLSESALLASIIPAPSRFSPRAAPEVAEQRRQRVLRTMLDQRVITQEQYGDAAYQPVWVYGRGPAPGRYTLIYPPEQQQSSDPYVTDYVYRWLSAHLPGGVDQIFRGGLRIDTTIDPVQQQAARDQVAAFLDGTDPDLRTSLVAVEPTTGFVRAFVSGRDFATDQVNYALGAAGGGSGRQPGSSFKPFVLAQALSEGITPEARYSGAPHQVGSDLIENYDGARYGTLDLRTATWKSVNTVYTRLILDAGVDKTMALAKAMGATGVRAYDPAVHGAAVALGVESVSPLDMASAYATLAARGQHAEPTPVVRVTDRDGKVILDRSKPTTSRVLEEGVADNVTAILQGVLTKGTAAGRGIDRPAAGKTGTTQDNKDAWFVGYTPTLSTAVWLGYENKTAATTKRLIGIKGVSKVTGGTHPARLWQQFMKTALAGVPVTEFTEPAPIVAVPDVVQIRERRGFQPGRRMYPAAGPASGGYVDDLGPPVADLPTTTTSTSTPGSTTSSSTTSTTDGGLLNRRATSRAGWHGPGR